MGTDHSKLVSSATLSSYGSGASRSTVVSLLLREDWDAVCQRLEHHPKEAVVEVKLSPTTVYSPMHVACGNSAVPLQVVQALVKADPEGPLRCSMSTLSSTHQTSKRRERVRSLSHSSGGSLVSSEDSTSVGSLGDAASVLRGDLTAWLPLHVAVHFGASLEVIQFLVEACPSSVVCKNGQGFLPLHLACQRACEDIGRLGVVSLLLETFPTGRYVPSSCEYGKTALEFMEERENVPPELMELLEGRSATSPPSPKSPRHSISLSDVVLQTIPSEPRSSTSRRWKLLKQSLGRAGKDPEGPTKLVLLVTSRRWTESLERLAKQPREAQVWTLCNAPRDPPCHSLPLHMALRRKAPLNVIQALVENYPESVHTREFYGMLPLHVACQSGCTLDVVQYLAEQHTVAIRAPDLTGLLPLHLACLSEGCRHPVITYLMDAYPDAMLIKDDKGFLAEDYVSNGNHPHQRMLLSEFNRGISYWAAAPSELGTLLCRRQWDAALERVNTHPEEATVWTKHPLHGRRRFALHMACRGKAPSHVVKKLLEICPEASKVAIDDFQLLPLHLAVQCSGSASTVQTLLSAYPKGASCPDSHGLLPLHLAVTEGACFDVVQVLVEAFQQGVAARDARGFTPIIYAEASFHPRSKKILELFQSVQVNDLKDGQVNQDGEETATTADGDEVSQELSRDGEHVPRSVTISSH